MKFLSLLFLSGLALAAAIPLSFHENALDLPVEDFDEYHFLANDDVSEIGKKLKDRLDEVLEKIKEAIENGKGLREDYIEKAKEIRQKLKDLKIDLGDRAKDLIEKLKEKAKDYWQKILDRLKPQESTLFADDDVKTELGKKLKEHLDQILEKIKDALENGKGLKEDYIEKAKEIRQKLKDLKIDLGDRAKELIEKLKEKAKDYWQKILDRLKPQESTLHSDTETELQNRLNEGLEKVKEVWDNREIDINIDLPLIRTLHDVSEKMNKQGIEISTEAKNRVNVLKVRASNKWRSILDQLFPSKQAGDFGIYDWNVSRSVQAGDFGIYDWNVSRSVQAGDFGIYDWNVSFADDVAHADSLFEIFNNLRILMKSKLDADQLRERIENLFGKGSELANQIINGLKEKGEEGKKKVLDWIDRVFPFREELSRRRSIKEVYEKIKNYFKELNIELKEKFVKFGEWAKEQYEKGLEKGKTKAENIKKIADEFIKDSKRVSKEVAEEALEFFREYKEDLGRVFDDIKEKVREVVKKDN